MFRDQIRKLYMVRLEVVSVLFNGSFLDNVLLNSLLGVFPHDSWHVRGS